MDSECSIEMPGGCLRAVSCAAGYADGHVLERVDDFGILAGQMLVESNGQFRPRVSLVGCMSIPQRG